MADFRTVPIAGAHYLAGLTAASGKFLYRFDLDQPSARPDGYNLLRHCGAIWAMTEVSNRLGPFPEVLAAARKATRWMIDGRIRLHRQTRTRCLVGNDSVKLGGNGLAILALCELAAATGERDYLRLAGDLAAYVLHQRREDGSFVHKRRYSDNKVLPFESDYYTGEALFGLLKLHRATGERIWLDFADACEQTLAPARYGVAQSSHWMAYMLEELHGLRPSDLVRNHAWAIAEETIRTSGGRMTQSSTQIACRTEGLMAFIRLCDGLPADLPDLGKWRERRRATAVAVTLNIRRQLDFYRQSGAFVDGPGSNEVRIDYIQHNISAFLAFCGLAEVRARAA